MTRTKRFPAGSLAALAASSGESSATIVKDVMSDVRAFAAGAKQSDDITVLAVRYVS